MKTAISLPDAIFRAASRRAAELGISRSEFFAVAARRYLAELDSASLTTRIDEALDGVVRDKSDSVAVTAGRDRLASGSNW